MYALGHGKFETLKHNVITCYKWHHLLQMASLVTNDIDHFRKGKLQQHTMITNACVTAFDGFMFVTKLHTLLTKNQTNL